MLDISMKTTFSMPLLIACAIASHAHAHDGANVAPDVWDKRYQIAINAGFGTPIGFLGAEAQLNASRYFGIAVGAGASGDGPQVMFGVRPRIPLTDYLAVSLSGSWSIGPHTQEQNYLLGNDGPEELPEFGRSWALAQWANLDLGVEARDVVQLRAYVGLADLLNPRAFSCSGEDLVECEAKSPDYEPTDVYPYIGLALGAAF